MNERKHKAKSFRKNYLKLIHYCLNKLGYLYNKSHFIGYHITIIYHQIECFRSIQTSNNLWKEGKSIEENTRRINQINQRKKNIYLSNKLQQKSFTFNRVGYTLTHAQADKSIKMKRYPNECQTTNKQINETNEKMKMSKDIMYVFICIKC